MVLTRFGKIGSLILSLSLVTVICACTNKLTSKEPKQVLPVEEKLLQEEFKLPEGLELADSVYGHLDDDTILDLVIVTYETICDSTILHDYNRDSCTIAMVSVYKQRNGKWVLSASNKKGVVPNNRQWRETRRFQDVEIDSLKRIMISDFWSTGGNWEGAWCYSYYSNVNGVWTLVEQEINKHMKIDYGQLSGCNYTINLLKGVCHEVKDNGEEEKPDTTYSVQIDSLPTWNKFYDFQERFMEGRW